MNPRTNPANANASANFAATRGKTRGVIETPLELFMRKTAVFCGFQRKTYLRHIKDMAYPIANRSAPLMTDDAKKLDEWRWEQAFAGFPTRIAEYRRLVVEDARPPELSEATKRMAKILGADFVPNRPPEPVDDGLEEAVRAALALAYPITVGSLVWITAALRTELASRGLAVRPVVEITTADIDREALKVRRSGHAASFEAAVRAGFLLGGGRIGEAE